MKEMLSSKARRHYLEKLFLVMIADGFTLVLSYFLALWIRFDFSIQNTPKENIDSMLLFLPLVEL